MDRKIKYGEFPGERKPMRHEEDNEQASLFRWAKPIPELEWLHAIPNGGKRAKKEASRLKMQGVKAGVLDIFLPLARCGYHGLYIEMKRKDGGNGLSKDQKKFSVDMTENNYMAVTCNGCDEAKIVLIHYAGIHESYH